MSFWARWDRYSPLAGVKAVVLWVIGVVILSSSGGMANRSDESPAEILAKYKDHATAIQWGAWFVMLVALAFLWFIGSLRSAIFAGEGGTGRLATLAGMGGAVTSLGILLAHAPSFAAASTTDNLTAAAAKALILMDYVFFYGAAFSSAVLFFAVALAIFRFAVFPRWLGWITVVLAAIAVIPPFGLVVLAVLLPVWTLVVSWLLFVQQRSAPAGTAAAGSTPVS